jgi:hypothetical protein
MDTPPSFDSEAAHRYFSAKCFNNAWDLIEKTDRSPEEDRLMVTLNQASLYHWLQRPDCSPKNLSVGYWQASRIQALLGNVTEARRCAEICQEYSETLAPFYRAYALEAFARAEALNGNRLHADEYLNQARELAEQVEDKEERDLLLNDLNTI